MSTRVHDLYKTFELAWITPVLLMTPPTLPYLQDYHTLRFQHHIDTIFRLGDDYWAYLRHRATIHSRRSGPWLYQRCCLAHEILDIERKVWRSLGGFYWGLRQIAVLDILLVGIAMEILIARDCEGRGGRLPPPGPERARLANALTQKSSKKKKKRAPRRGVTPRKGTKPPFKKSSGGFFGLFKISPPKDSGKANVSNLEPARGYSAKTSSSTKKPADSSNKGSSSKPSTSSTLSSPSKTSASSKPCASSIPTLSRSSSSTQPISSSKAASKSKGSPVSRSKSLLPHSNPKNLQQSLIQEEDSEDESGSLDEDSGSQEGEDDSSGLDSGEEAEEDPEVSNIRKQIANLSKPAEASKAAFPKAPSGGHSDPGGGSASIQDMGEGRVFQLASMYDPEPSNWQAQDMGGKKDKGKGKMFSSKK